MIDVDIKALRKREILRLRAAMYGRKAGYRWCAQRGGLLPERSMEDAQGVRYLTFLE